MNELNRWEETISVALWIVVFLFMLFGSIGGAVYLARLLWGA